MVEVLNWDRSSFLKGCVQGNIHKLQLFFFAFDAPFPKKKREKKKSGNQKVINVRIKEKKTPKKSNFHFVTCRKTNNYCVKVVPAPKICFILMVPHRSPSNLMAPVTQQDFTQ